MSKKALVVLASLLVVACQGSDVINPGTLVGPVSLGVVDGANGGNDDFWFLSPLVANPQGNPKYLDNGFDNSLASSLTVSVQRTAPSVGAVIAVPVSLNGNHYTASYQTPKGAATYKIAVSVGSTELGSIDVTTDKNGKNLAIKFVVENCALVVGACATKTFDLDDGGTVATEDGGVKIPGQPGPTIKVTVTGCPDIPNDLPKKSDCVRVTTDPPLSTPLVLPATVWVCGVPPALPGTQDERITMYRYDAPSTQTALAHADDDCEIAPPVIGLRAGMKNMVADLVHFRLRSAGRQLASLVSPKVLYAATMLDVGAGGFTDAFSDFQLVLPASMAPCPANPTSGIAGAAITAKVCVTDVGGDPVEGATVHFGAPVSAAVATDANGEASVSWTLALGANSLTASGVGIGGDDNNGPRVGVDPFQPLSTHFGDANDGSSVPVLTGSITLSATGLADNPLPINYGSSGWSYQIDGSPSATWMTSAISPFTLTGAAPFGSPSVAVVCPLNDAGFATSWPPGEPTFLYARRTFTLTSAAAVQVRVAIDNDIQVFIDGNDISGGLVVHEGCPTTDSFTFTSGPLSAGTHVLAIVAKDRGGNSYFDARVTVYSP